MSLESRANRCFVCGPGNAVGLDVRFRLEGEVCHAQFTPGANHVGYDKVTHGGIIFSLLDDVMANWLWLRGDQCFTARADIRYHAQLPIGTTVNLEGRCQRRRGRLVLMEGQALRADTGELVARANGSFMIAHPEA